MNTATLAKLHRGFQLEDFRAEAGKWPLGDRMRKFLEFHTLDGKPIIARNLEPEAVEGMLGGLSSDRLAMLAGNLADWFCRPGKLKGDYPEGFPLDGAPVKPKPYPSKAALAARAAERARFAAWSKTHEAAQIERERRELRQQQTVEAWQHGRPLPFERSTPKAAASDAGLFESVAEEHPAADDPFEETAEFDEDEGDGPPPIRLPGIPNIHQRMARVYGEIGKIAASRRHSQGYAYIPQSAITARIRELCGEIGIVIETHLLRFESGEYVTKDGKRGEMCTVAVRFALVNADIPEDRIVFDEWIGRDIDFNEKALQKAVTNAKKTFLTNQFLVSEEEGEDLPANGQQPRNQAAPPPPPQPKPPPERAAAPKQPPPVKQPETKTASPPPAQPKAATDHRTMLLDMLKTLRDAVKAVGLSCEPMTTNDVLKLRDADIEKKIGVERARLLERILLLERKIHELGGPPPTPKADLWELDDDRVAARAVAVHKRLVELEPK